MSFDGAVEQSGYEPRSAASLVGVAEITHEDVRGLLSDYLDDSLPVQSQDRIAAHLSQCRSCRAFLNTLRATRDLVAGLPRQPAPDTARRRVLMIPDE